MSVRSFRFLEPGLSAAALIFVASLCRASVIDVTIDTTALQGDAAVLVFDFVDGGPPDNSVTLSALTSDGTQGALFSVSGNVTGTGPWTFSDAGGSFFNELQVAFDAMGTSLSFQYTTTDNPPDASSFPDAFSMFVLDPSGTLALITTDDPTGADALFLSDIGQGPQGLAVYTADQAGFSVSTSSLSAPVPEPGVLWLLLAGVMAFFAPTRQRPWRPSQRRKAVNALTTCARPKP
jgi:hypothetical protein